MIFVIKKSCYMDDPNTDEFAIQKEYIEFVKEFAIVIHPTATAEEFGRLCREYNEESAEGIADELERNHGFTALPVFSL
jgi:hypothetical protein